MINPGCTKSDLGKVLKHGKVTKDQINDECQATKSVINKSLEQSDLREATTIDVVNNPEALILDLRPLATYQRIIEIYK